jgi:2'-5' RNA ligase
VSLSVCLMLDPRADAAVRRLWARLEEDGVRTLASHTHGRHVPHLTLASVLTVRTGRSDADPDAEATGTDPMPETLYAALSDLPPPEPLVVGLDALGIFPRSRCWLVPGVSADLLERQSTVVGIAHRVGAEVHRSYEPGTWVPHVTLAPRMRLDQLSTVAARCFEILPLTATLERAALIDTATGELRPLPPPPRPIRHRSARGTDRDLR